LDFYTTFYKLGQPFIERVPPVESLRLCSLANPCNYQLARGNNRDDMDIRTNQGQGQDPTWIAKISKDSYWEN
jgi:hypothetical protein